MSKYLIISLAALFSLNSYSKGWEWSGKWNNWWKKNSYYYKEHIVITPKINPEYKVSAGEKVVHEGSICLKNQKPQNGWKWYYWKNKSKTKNDIKCGSIDDSDIFSKHELRFFHPDTNTDVTDKVVVTKVNNELQYHFESDEINPDMMNRFTVMVKERDYKVRKYLRYQAKVKRYITLVEKYKEKNRFKRHIEKYLEKLNKILVRLDEKIEKRMNLDPRVYSRLSYPVQVENKIAPPVVYSKVVSGFKLNLEISSGVLFEGEKSIFNASIVNLNEKEDDEKGDHKDYWRSDKYKWKYWAELAFNDLTVKQSDKILLKDGLDINFEFVTDKLNIQDLNNIGLRFYRGKEVPKWASSYNYLSKQTWGEIDYKLDVLSDNVLPIWTEGNIEDIYTQSLSLVTGTIEDSLGRVDKDSIEFQISGTKLDGGLFSLDLKPVAEFIKIDDEFLDNINNGANGYDINAQVTALAEGDYTFIAKAKDFAGNEAAQIENIIHIDRTKPVLTINQADNQLTNNSSFKIDYEVVDNSPVTIKLKQNGIETSLVTSAVGSFDILLNEGINQFKIDVVDAAGNIGDSIRLDYIKLDTIAPEFSDVKPVSGSSLFDLKVAFSGKANEELSEVLIDGNTANINSNNFSLDILKGHEGQFSSEIVAKDLAGNETSINLDYEIILKILRIDLVSLAPMDGKIFIIGQPGSSRAGATIEVDGGFFNDGSVVTKEDGSFVLGLSHSNLYNITAIDNNLNQEEEYSLKYNTDTTLSGIVKDVDGTPLSNVLIKITSTGQETRTDSSGVFMINKPATGDQKILVDAREVGLENPNREKSYSFSYFNVSLGTLQRNALDRVIYFAPTFLDSEDIDTTVQNVVTSERAPGVSLVIPANTVVFPSAVPRKISIQEIPSDRTTIDLLEHSQSDTVYALEPSGVSFKEPVKLTLPNPNGFAVGTELVIMSKNSASGYWEPDGAAIVASSGMIETKEGDGITHFSEVYATPYGVKVEDFSADHRPGIYNEEGALTKTVQLPTYKTNGVDIGLSMNYNSFWANPNVFVTNSFNITNEHIYRRVNESGGGFGTQVKVDGFIEEWIKPEYLKSQFTSGPVQTDWLYFDVSNPPEKATVSYSVDMAEAGVGRFPAIANYVLQYRHIKVQRIRIRKERVFGGTFTKYMNEDINELMDKIFPPPLQTNLYIQNKQDSSMGSGWKLAANERIYNPDDNQVVIEESNGRLTPYAVKSSIESLYRTDKKINHLAQSSSGKIIAFNDDNSIGEISGKAFQKWGEMPSEKITIGINQYIKSTNYQFGCTSILDPSCVPTEYRDYRARYDCRFHKYEGDSQVIPRSAVVDGNEIFLVDSKHRFYKLNNLKKVIKAGNINNSSHYLDYEERTRHYNTKIVQYPTDHVFSPDVNTWCEKDSFTGCGRRLYYTSGTNYVHHDHTTWGCREVYSGRVQNSSLPTTGSRNGSIVSSHFNNPRGIVRVSPTEFLIADRGNHVIRLLDFENNTSSDWAGNRQVSGDDLNGLRRSVRIHHPNAITKDKFGNIYVASGRGYIRRIDPNGRVYHIAGNTNGTLDYGTIDAKDAFFNNPGGLAVDSDRGLLYVADTGNNRIVEIDLSRGKAKTIIGKNVCDKTDIEDGKNGLSTSVCSPKDLFLDESGNLIYLDNKVDSNQSLNISMVRKYIRNHSSDGVERYQPINSNDNSSLLRLADGTFERSFRNGTKNFYSQDGLHLESIDKVGNATRFEYTNDKVTRIIDPVGRETSIEYSNGMISSITDPSGLTTSFNYDGTFLEKIEFPDGTSESYSYNNKGMMLSETNKRNFVTSYKYNESDKLIKITRPDEKIIEFTDGLQGTFTANNYDEDSKIEISSEEEQEFSDIYTDAKGYETTVKKDFNGIVYSITDSKDRVTTIERDVKGRPIKITRFDDTFTEFEYNSFGDLVYKFDSESGEKESFEYNEEGSILSYKNSNDNSRTNVYDSENNLLIKEIDFNGNSIYREYYNDGLVKSVKNDFGEVTNFIYDEFGNLVKRISPEGEETEYKRDIAGNIVEKINSNGVSTLYEYDVFNRLTQVNTGVSSSDPVGKVTSYEYSASGQLEKIIDPQNNETAFEYDVMDRLVKKVSPLNQITELEYDGNNNIVWEKDPNGNVKTFEYDSDNLLVKKVLSDNVYEMNYDEFGNMVDISDLDSSISFEYKKIGKEYYVKKTNISGTDIPTVELSYNYDILGNREDMITPYGDFSYAYDAGNRLKTIVNHKNEVFDFSYDETNRLTQVDRPGSVTNFDFDKNSFLTSLVHEKKTSGTINSFIYTRDNLGNRKSITSTRGIANYNYDDESQLTSVSNSELSGDYANEVFDYDDLGNRLNDQLGSFTYDAKSQRLTEDYKNVYTYDLNGNMTSVQEKGMTGNFRNLGYSVENQLIKVDEYKANVLVKSVEYFYDALGRRSRKVILDKLDTTKSFERKYVYDGHEILAEYDGSNSILGVYTHSTLRTDDVLAVDAKSTKLANSTGSYFYLKDALGSVSDIVDGSGNLIQHYTYSSFGKILKITDGSGNDITNNAAVKTSYAFANREMDSETGMYYNRARYYMPEIGRFISEDSFAGVTSLPSSLNNKYIYTYNNPQRLKDPTGNFPWLLFAVGAAISFGSTLMEGMNSTDENGNKRGLTGEVFGAALWSGLMGGLQGALGGLSGWSTLLAIPASAALNWGMNIGNQMIYNNWTVKDWGSANTAAAYGALGGAASLGAAGLNFYFNDKFVIGASALMGLPATLSSESGVPDNPEKVNCAKEKYKETFFCTEL